MLYRIVKEIRTNCRPGFLLLVKKKYPFLIVLICNFVMIPLFILQLYRMSYNWNIAYADIKYCLEVLLPIIALLCPMILYMDCYHPDCRELIFIYKKNCIPDVIMLYILQMLQVMMIYGYLSFHISSIFMHFWHLAVVLLFYNCLYSILVSLFENVILSFFVVMLYHYFGITSVYTANDIIRYLFFITRDQVSFKQYLYYTGCSMLFLKGCMIINDRKKYQM